MVAFLWTIQQVALTNYDNLAANSVWQTICFGVPNLKLML